MKYPKGSSIAVGVAVGLAIGLATDNIISMIALGLTFGIIGEMANDKKE